MDRCMESRDLKVFQAVAREGSITKAAYRLGYVQPNLTAIIKNLERELQTPLFHRSKKGMTMTSAGQHLLGHADKILHLLDIAQKELTNNDIPNGLIRLGSIETAAAVHLTPLMLNYRRNFPKVKLSLFNGNTNELVQKVIQYELDGAFINGPVRLTQLEQIPAFEEELVLISEPGIEELTEVLKKPFLFFGAGCYYRERLESWLDEDGIEIPDIMEFGTLEAVFGGVEAGLGNSILPRSTIRRLEKEGVVRVHVLPKKYRFTTVHFIYRRDLFLTYAFRKFIDQLAKQISSKSENA